MELSLEENKAIETLKEVASDDFDTLGDDISPKMAQNILNVIEKKQKEIEELQTKLEIEKIDNKYNQEERDEETIPRCKIREKIKEIKKCKDISQVVGSIVILEELLEDNKNEIKM